MLLLTMMASWRGSQWWAAGAIDDGWLKMLLHFDPRHIGFVDFLGGFLYAESVVQQLKMKFLLLVVFKNVGKLTEYEIFLFINFNAVFEMQNNFLEQEQEQVVCMTEHIKSRWFLQKISCRKMDQVWLVWNWWQSNQNLRRMYRIKLMVELADLKYL